MKSNTQSTTRGGKVKEMSKVTVANHLSTSNLAMQPKISIKGSKNRDQGLLLKRELLNLWLNLTMLAMTSINTTLRRFKEDI